MSTKENLISTIGTKDGAETYFNKKYNESYHSYVGPIIEAKHKFIEPSHLKELFSRKETAKILDPFFGLGYNTGIFIHETLKTTNSNSIEITAIEKDPFIIDKIKSLNVPENYSTIRDFLGNLQSDKSLYMGKIKIKLIIDDIQNILETLEKDFFDLIFYDPFSHKTTPEFWEKDFLIKMFMLLTTNGRLCTYSSMKKLELLALENGLKVEKISPLGRKKHSLVLVKQ